MKLRNYVSAQGDRAARPPVGPGWGALLDCLADAATPQVVSQSTSH